MLFFRDTMSRLARKMHTDWRAITQSYYEIKINNQTTKLFDELVFSRLICDKCSRSGRT